MKSKRGGKRPGAGKPKGKKSDVTLAREAARKVYLEREALTAERVLEEMRRLAFSDIRCLFDEKGQLRPLHELTAEQAAAIGGAETVQRNLTAGDGSVDTIHKIKMWDKPKSLEMLAKHFALLTERVEVSGNADFLALLHEGRQRAAGKR